MVVSLILPEHAITNFVNSGSVALIKVSSLKVINISPGQTSLHDIKPHGTYIGTQLDTSTISVFCLSLTTGVHSFQLDR